MYIKTNVSFYGRSIGAFTASAFLASALLQPSVACEQTARPVPASPGDSIESPGPVASLSPALKRSEVIRATKLVADWQLARMPEQPQRDWTYAVLHIGFMAVPQQVAGDRYRNAMLDLAKKLDWLPGPEFEFADDQAIGQMYMQHYFIHRKPAMMKPMQARLDLEIQTPDNPAKPLWWWCDALFMAPPVFAAMGRATGDEKYLAFMDHEWEITQSRLYDPQAHLFSRDAAWIDKHEKNGAKVFWSRGNGWVMAGIVRVLEQLPKDSPLRPKYVKLLQEMSAAVIRIQGRDGLWRAGLLDADAYPLPENSGSAFMAYALAYGVNEGILERKVYQPAVEKAWSGMLAHVYANGRFGCIQPVGASPDKFTETSSYSYGVGAYLLAASEVYRLAK